MSTKNHSAAVTVITGAALILAIIIAILTAKNVIKGNDPSSPDPSDPTVVDISGVISDPASETLETTAWVVDETKTSANEGGGVSSFARDIWYDPKYKTDDERRAAILEAYNAFGRNIQHIAAIHDHIAKGTSQLPALEIKSWRFGDFLGDVGWSATYNVYYKNGYFDQMNSVPDYNKDGYSIKSKDRIVIGLGFDLNGDGVVDTWLYDLVECFNSLTERRVVQRVKDPEPAKPAEPSTPPSSQDHPNIGIGVNESQDPALSINVDEEKEKKKPAPTPPTRRPSKPSLPPNFPEKTPEPKDPGESSEMNPNVSNESKPTSDNTNNTVNDNYGNGLDNKNPNGYQPSEEDNRRTQEDAEDLAKQQHEDAENEYNDRTGGNTSTGNDDPVNVGDNDIHGAIDDGSNQDTRDEPDDSSGNDAGEDTSGDWF